MLGAWRWVILDGAVLHDSLSCNSKQWLLLNVNLIQVLRSILHIRGRLIHKKEQE